MCDARAREIIIAANDRIQGDLIYRAFRRRAIVVPIEAGGEFAFIEKGRQVARTDPLFGVFATTMRELGAGAARAS